MAIKKSNRKSFFIRNDLRSLDSGSLFNEYATFRGEDVVILQVMHCSEDVVIVELIRKEDYEDCKEKYYHDGKEIEV